MSKLHQLHDRYGQSPWPVWHRAEPMCCRAGTTDQRK